MDLDQIYAVSKDTITEEIGNARFTGRRFNTASVKYHKIRDKRAKPLQKLISAKIITPEQDRKLAIQCFVDAVFEGVPNAFEGVRWRGQDIPYSFDEAVELFMQVDELYIDLAYKFGDRKSFQEDVEDIAKN